MKLLPIVLSSVLALNFVACQKDEKNERSEKKKEEVKNLSKVQAPRATASQPGVNKKRDLSPSQNTPMSAANPEVPLEYVFSLMNDTYSADFFKGEQADTLVVQVYDFTKDQFFISEAILHLSDNSQMGQAYIGEIYLLVNGVNELTNISLSPSAASAGYCEFVITSHDAPINENIVHGCDAGAIWY